MDIKADFIQRLRGRAEFCRDSGEVKTPELLEHAAELLEAAKSQAVPEGFVLVPKEPTKAMVEAGKDSSECGGWPDEIYKAMIEAQEPVND